ncbi:MAG: cytochrome c oxidase subunit II [Ktedonobacterales bacterium]
MHLHSKGRRWAGFTVLALVAMAILSACDTSGDNIPSILDTHGPVAEKQAGFFWFIFWVATIIFVLVTSVLLVSVFRFRAREGSAPARQVHGSTTLELAWTIVPSLVLFGVLGVTVNTLFNLAPTGGPAMDVTAVGHQWWWEFQYTNPNGGPKVITADEMHIPAGTVVHIHLVSNNVIHSFWVPQLGGKLDVIPGHDNVLTLKANDAGQSYRGECTEFCGLQHAHMDFVVKTDTPDGFQTWLTAQSGQAVTPATGSPEANGLQVFQHAGCVACHNIGGVTQPGNKIGPDLTHFGSRTLIAGGVLTNTPENLTNWILHAQQVKEGSDMPSFDGTPGSGNGGKALSDQEISDLVAYLESLK